MKKEVRQNSIIDILKRKTIQTQKDLADELNYLGIESTQATISRDIKELNIVKVQDHNGSSFYTIIDDISYGNYNINHEIFKLAVLEILASNRIVIINTISKAAGICADYIKSLNLNGVLAIVYSDDTIRLDLDQEENCDSIIKRIRKELQ